MLHHPDESLVVTVFHAILAQVLSQGECYKQHTQCCYFGEFVLYIILTIERNANTKHSLASMILSTIDNS